VFSADEIVNIIGRRALAKAVRTQSHWLRRQEGRSRISSTLTMESAMPRHRNCMVELDRAAFQRDLGVRASRMVSPLTACAGKTVD